MSLTLWILLILAGFIVICGCSAKVSRALDSSPHVFVSLTLRKSLNAEKDAEDNPQL